MATHSSTLAWRLSWTEEPGRLQSTGVAESDATERLHFLSFIRSDRVHLTEEDFVSSLSVLVFRGQLGSARWLDTGADRCCARAACGQWRGSGDRRTPGKGWGCLGAGRAAHPPGLPAARSPSLPTSGWVGHRTRVSDAAGTVVAQSLLHATCHDPGDSS